MLFGYKEIEGSSLNYYNNLIFHFTVDSPFQGDRFALPDPEALVDGGPGHHPHFVRVGRPVQVVHCSHVAVEKNIPN